MPPIIGALDTNQAYCIFDQNCVFAQRRKDAKKGCAGEGSLLVYQKDKQELDLRTYHLTTEAFCRHLLLFSFAFFAALRETMSAFVIPFIKY